MECDIAKRPLDISSKSLCSGLLSVHTRSGTGGPIRSSISCQLKTRRSLELINELDTEEPQEVVGGDKVEDSCFLELLERLRKEHEREVSVLRTALKRSAADLTALEQRYQVDLGEPASPGAVRASSSSSSSDVSKRSSAASSVHSLEETKHVSRPLLPRSYSLSVIPAPAAAPQELDQVVAEVEESMLVESVCKAQEDTVCDNQQSRTKLLGKERALSPELQSIARGNGNRVSRQTIAEEPDMEMSAAELPGITDLDPEEVASSKPVVGRSATSICITSEPRLSATVPSQLGLDSPRGLTKSNSFQSGLGAGPALPRIPGFGLKRSGSALKQPGSGFRSSALRNSSLKHSGSFLSRQGSVTFDQSSMSPGSSSDGSSDGSRDVSREVQADRQHTSADSIVPLPLWQQVMDPQSSDAAMRKKDLSRCLSGDNLSSFGEQVVKSFTVGIHSPDSQGAFLDSFVGHPSSSFNFACDIASMFFIFYDLVTIPLGVFNVEDWLFFRMMHAPTTVFWTLDLVRHFFKGHYAQGDVVMTFRPAAVHYLKTWAVPDACLVCSDWAEWFSKMLDSTELSPGTSRLFRLMRNVRGVRLLRGVKTGDILKMIEDRINSEVVGTVWNMVKFLIFIICATHVMACTWYFIGGVYDSSVPNWRTEFLESHPFGETFVWRYTTSFHWAITQFTPASIKVQPENSAERIFAICCLLLAFVSMSSFISGLTSAVMQLRQLSAKKQQQFWLLRQYLTQGNVPTKLSVRINNYCQHAWQMRGKRSQEKSVELLQLLSASLRTELKIAIFSPRIANHAFFMLLHIVAPDTIRSTCAKVLTQCEVTRGDDLFTFGEDAHHMFFTEQRELEYKMRAHKEGGLVTSTDWVCEACLWTVWVYRGTLTAVCESHAVAVESDGLGKILILCPDARHEAMAYAKTFVQGINREPPWKLNDLYKSGSIEGLWFRLMKDFQVTRGMNPSTRSMSSYRHSSVFQLPRGMAGFCRSLRLAQWRVR